MSGKRRPPLLIVAAVDPSAGAGLLLDLAVARSLGAGAVGAVSALTAQGMGGLRGLEPTPPRFLKQQLGALEQDEGRPAVVKLGALGSAANAQLLNTWAGRHPLPRIVLDPVVRPSRGKSRLYGGSEAGYRRALRGLLKRTFLLTPNLPEAQWLLGEELRPYRDERALRESAERLLQLGPEAVLLKGGHGGGSRSTDILVTRSGRTQRFTHKRLPGTYHGTGCFLASAVAAGLWKGHPLARAIEEAEKALHHAMRDAEIAGRTKVKRLVP